MDETKIKQIVLNLNNLLKTKYNKDIVFSGAYALYLQGIELNREFNDIDVKILDIDPNIPRYENIEFEVPIHFLGNIEVPLEYKEIEVNNEKILVYTIESILNCKKHTLLFNQNRKFKTEKTDSIIQKQTEDLDYIKEKYGIE